MEYSTILVLEYFEDTLANVGLPEAWLKCDSNCVTQIENKYVRHESNRIGKKSESSQIETTIEYNQTKLQLSLIKSKIVSIIKLKTVTRKTADTDDGASVRKLMQWCAGSWCNDAVLAVIATAAVMHRVVEVGLDVDIDLAVA